MVGSTDTLGNWDPQRGVGMQWSEGDVWYVDLEVPACGHHLEMEYKYVIRDPDGSACTWKPGSNYRLSLASLSPVLASAARHSLVGGVAVRDAWDGAVRDVSVEVGEGRRALTEAMRAHSASLALALDELANQIVHAEGLGGAQLDLAAPELLQADRMLAAASRKVAAAAYALESAQPTQQLPAPATSAVSVR